MAIDPDKNPDNKPEPAGGGAPAPAPEAAVAAGGGSTGSKGLEADRRDFMVKAASFVFGGVVVAIPAGAGLVTFVSPLMRQSPGGLVVRLAAVSDLPADGTPKRFDVVAEKVDAWMKYPKKPIGGVYLRRLPDGQVVAFNTSCPHAGCSVGFRPEQGEVGGYYCPCHKSEFEIDGSRGAHCVSARGLDTLEVDAEKLKEGGEVWVTFKNFRAGIADKKEIS